MPAAGPYDGLDVARSSDCLVDGGMGLGAVVAGHSLGDSSTSVCGVNHQSQPVAAIAKLDRLEEPFGVSYGAHDPPPDTVRAAHAGCNR